MRAGQPALFDQRRDRPVTVHACRIGAAGALGSPGSSCGCSTPAMEWFSERESDRVLFCSVWREFLLAGFICCGLLCGRTGHRAVHADQRSSTDRNMGNRRSPAVTWASTRSRNSGRPAKLSQETGSSSRRCSVPLRQPSRGSPVWHCLRHWVRTTGLPAYLIPTFCTVP